MTRTYAQIVIDDLYSLGVIDHHFLFELFSLVNKIRVAPYRMQDYVELKKTKEQEFEDVLTLVDFFIASGTYEGFFMPDYGRPYHAFKMSSDFQAFIRTMRLEKVNFFDVMIDGDERYTVGLAKIKDDAKAPPVTPEVEKIFVIPDSVAEPAKAHKSFWGKALGFFRE